MNKQYSIPSFPDGAQNVCDAGYIAEKNGRWIKYLRWNDNYYFSHVKEHIVCRRLRRANFWVKANSRRDCAPNDSGPDSTLPTQVGE